MSPDWAPNVRFEPRRGREGTEAMFAVVKEIKWRTVIMPGHPESQELHEDRLLNKNTSTSGSREFASGMGRKRKMRAVTYACMSGRNASLIALTSVISTAKTDDIDLDGEWSGRRLGITKKCEEVSRHLSSRGIEGDDKKPSVNSNRKNCCFTNWGSSAQLSLEQIDGLLGTNLVDYTFTSDRSDSEQHLLTNIDKRKRKANVAVASLPPCARSDTSRVLLARRRKCQGELLKSEALCTLARRIHDGNFYRSLQDKIANAFTISNQKHRVDRQGLSADWEFYVANHHPKIPLNDKNFYVHNLHELSSRPTKRSTLLPSNSRKPALSSVSGTNKRHAIADKSKSIAKSKLASRGKPSKSGGAQCNAIIQGKCQLRATTKNSGRPLTIPGFTATSNTGDEGKIKQRPSSSQSEFLSRELDGEIRDKGNGTAIVTKKPSTTSQLVMTSTASGLDCRNEVRSGHRAGSTGMRSKFKLRNSPDHLPSCTMAGFREHSLKSQPKGGLSTLAPIERLFPIVN